MSRRSNGSSMSITTPACYPKYSPASVPRVAQDISKKDRRQPDSEVVSPGRDRQHLNTHRQRSGSILPTLRQTQDHPQGTGARDVRLFRNGSLVKVWHGDALKGQSTATLEEEISIIAGPNRLTAYAFNGDNVKSKDANLVLTGADSLKRAGTAWVIAVGVNEYANSQYNLKYAVADANSFAEELQRQQTQLARFSQCRNRSPAERSGDEGKYSRSFAAIVGSQPSAPTLKAGPLDRSEAG